jgi:hypothetical protein
VVVVVVVNVRVAQGVGHEGGGDVHAPVGIGRILGEVEEHLLELQRYPGAVNRLLCCCVRFD